MCALFLTLYLTPENYNPGTIARELIRGQSGPIVSLAPKLSTLVSIWLVIPYLQIRV